jgi:NADP-dependent aldehyde dehydrogenase
MGVGQFCTKPGIVVLPDASADFTAKLFELAGSSPAAPLLTPGIKANYEKGIGERIVSGQIGDGELTGFAVNVSAFQTTAEAFLKDPSLGDEIFGPTTLLVASENREQLLALARSLEGQLTASVFGTEEDLRDFADLLAILETKAGRLVFNAFPTGVEVCHSMVHGGPYPATSDSRSTSVGTRSIDRFSRLVCYQGFPEGSLPDELKDTNPLQIWRLVDGEFGK